MLAAAGLLAVSSQAFATTVSVDITTSDNASNPIYGFNGGPDNPGGFALGSTLFPTNSAGEDNETEAVPGLYTVNDQSWDLEQLVLKRTLNGANQVTGSTLNLVSGFNLAAGNENWLGGDLFIKIGGSAPGTGPTTGSNSDTFANSLFGDGGYSYVVHLTTGVASSFSASVYQLSGSSILTSVNWAGLQSNPWKYVPTTGASFTTSGSYTSNIGAVTASGITGLVSTGNLLGDTVTGLLGSSTQQTALVHNVLSLDLGFLSGLAPNGTNVYFSYAEQCGNDSIKGSFGGGFDQTNVPDGGSSIALVGIGLLGACLFNKRQRRA